MMMKYSSLVLVLLVSGAIGGMLILPGNPLPGQEKAGAAVAKWEYKTMGQVDEVDPQALDKLGGEGWELCGTINMVSSFGGKNNMISTNATLIFKRPKR